ncbi:putative DD41D transposase [Trichonephila clavipes]|nr:putative DD41D transposase [Trichonephila clavipes]
MSVIDHTATSRIIAQQIKSITHHSVSTSTIRRRLQQSEMSARRPLLRLSLTGNHRHVRRQRRDERQIWTTEWNDIMFTDENPASACNITMVGIEFGDTGFGLAIHQNDHQARRRFIEWVQNEIAVVPDFHKRILFSDEAHFWLNGYVNKQNCRIWSETNPEVHVETPLHPEKLTVRCALWAGGIIGPYFFKNDEGHNVTVNGDRYTAMITNFFIPELNNHDVQELWFQQDGATCHTARATIDLLKDTFGDRLISRFGPVN